MLVPGTPFFCSPGYPSFLRQSLSELPGKAALGEHGRPGLAASVFPVLSHERRSLAAPPLLSSTFPCCSRRWKALWWPVFTHVIFLPLGFSVPTVLTPAMWVWVRCCFRLCFLTCWPHFQSRNSPPCGSGSCLALSLFLCHCFLCSFWTPVWTLGLIHWSFRFSSCFFLT